MGRELGRGRTWLRLLLVAAISAATGACVTDAGPPSPYYDYPYYGWYTAPHYGGYYPGYFSLHGSWGRHDGWHGAHPGGTHSGGRHPGGSGGRHH